MRETLRRESAQALGGSWSVLRIPADHRSRRPDRSLASNAPGQSAQPGSPFYGNLVENLGNGEYLPTRDHSPSKAVKGHDLGPGINNVTHKLILCVVSCINFRDCAQLGVRPKDKVNRSGSPFEIASRALTTLVDAL